MDRYRENICFRCAERIEASMTQCPHCGYDNLRRENAPSDLADMILADQYYVGRTLGRGGFGITYIGRDLKLDRKVAIKEYFPQGVAIRNADRCTLQPYGGEATRQFVSGKSHALREARRVANINIANVMQVYNVLEENGTVYIIMEYIEGSTLMDLIEKSGPMTPKDMYLCLEPIMYALNKVHSDYNIVHRDISPDNIMRRTRNGEAVLLDFGAAREIKGDNGKMTVVLRHGYAPLEQYLPDSLQDGRTDEYALCATMYYMLSGKKPPNANERLLYETQTVTDSNPDVSMLMLPTTVNARVRRVILKGMSLRPNERYDTIEELRSELKQAVYGEPVHNNRQKTNQRQRSSTASNSKDKPKRKGAKWLAIMAAVAFVGIAVLLVKPLLTQEPEQLKPEVSFTAFSEDQTEVNWFVEGAKSYNVVLKDASGKEVFVLQNTESAHVLGPSSMFENCTASVTAIMKDGREVTY